MSNGSHVQEDENSFKNKVLSFIKSKLNSETFTKLKEKLNFKNIDFKSVDKKKYIPAAVVALLLLLVIIAALKKPADNTIPVEDNSIVVEDDSALESVLLYDNNILLSDNTSFSSRAYTITLSDDESEAIFVKAFSPTEQYLGSIADGIASQDVAVKKTLSLAKVLTPSFFDGQDIDYNVSGSSELGRYEVNFSHKLDSDKILIVVSAEGKLEEYNVFRTEDTITISVGDKSITPYCYGVVNSAPEYERTVNLPELPVIDYTPDMKLNSSWSLKRLEGKVFTTDGKELLSSAYFGAPFSAFSALEPGKYIVQMALTKDTTMKPMKMMCFAINIPDDSPYIPFTTDDMHDIVKAENKAFPDATPIYNAADLDWLRYQLMLGQKLVYGDCKFDLPVYFTRDDNKILVAYPSNDGSPYIYAGDSCYHYDDDTSEFFNKIFENG